MLDKNMCHYDRWDKKKYKAMKKSGDQGNRSLRQVSYFSDAREFFQMFVTSQQLNQRKEKQKI